MSQVYHLPCEVLKSVALGENYHRLILFAPKIVATAKPGQFLHCAPGAPEETLALLRRPLSISDIVAVKSDNNPDSVELIFRTTGLGTRLLAAKKPGEVVDCLGPLGNGFTLKPERLSLLIAGGMGIVPLRWLAKELKRQGSEVYLLMGVRSIADSPCKITKSADRFVLPDLEEIGIMTEIVSEEDKGLVTDRLMQKLPNLISNPRGIQIYAVGPRPMFETLARVLPEDIPTQISLEERMACGIGACRSCVVSTKDTSKSGPDYKRVCKDGPVFDLHEIIWSAE